MKFIILMLLILFGSATANADLIMSHEEIEAACFDSSGNYKSNDYGCSKNLTKYYYNNPTSVDEDWKKPLTRGQCVEKIVRLKRDIEDMKINKQYTAEQQSMFIEGWKSSVESLQKSISSGTGCK